MAFAIDVVCNRVRLKTRQQHQTQRNNATHY